MKSKLWTSSESVVSEVENFRHGKFYRCFGKLYSVSIKLSV